MWDGEDVGPRPPRVEQLLTEEAPQAPTHREKELHASALALFDNIKFVFMCSSCSGTPAAAARTSACRAERSWARSSACSTARSASTRRAHRLHADRRRRVRRPDDQPAQAVDAAAPRRHRARGAVRLRRQSTGRSPPHPVERPRGSYALATARAFVGGAQLAGLSAARSARSPSPSISSLRSAGTTSSSSSATSGSTTGSRGRRRVVRRRRLAWFTFILYFAVGCLLPAESCSGTKRGSPLLWRLASSRSASTFLQPVAPRPARRTSSCRRRRSSARADAVHIEFTIISTLSPI